MSLLRLCLALLFVQIGCGRDAGAVKSSPADSPRPLASDTTASPSTAVDAMVRATEDVVRFLRGEADLEVLSVADTVEFFLPVEAGGTRQRLPRDVLRDRHRWMIRSGAQQYSFVPSGLLTEMTVKAGGHFNCRETSLGSRVPALSDAPYVGVRLQAPGATSCLQGWNATFVFDTTSGAVRLTGAVYDQWEW